MDTTHPPVASQKPQRAHRIGLHSLYIQSIDVSLDFYQKKLGFQLYQKFTLESGDTHCYLGLASRPLDHDLHKETDTLLHLIHAPKVTPQTLAKPGYWKLGITLADVDFAYQKLKSSGVEVSEPQQFLNIGYLCHLADPDGHAIELLQHRFKKNQVSITPDDSWTLGSQPRLSQVTLRVKDIESSLHFYTQVLGMRLMSRQIVESHRFTLYFLAFTEDELPYPHIDAIKNREWLWQRPYAQLELQHIWDNTDHYQTDPETGFDSVTLVSQSFDTSYSDSVEAETPMIEDPIWGKDKVTVRDPDGYCVHVVKAEPIEGSH